jgi:hypothetical protein
MKQRRQAQQMAGLAFTFSVTSNPLIQCKDMLPMKSLNFVHHNQPVARPLPAHRAAKTQNKRKQTSMPQVGFAPTIPVFEQAETVHALDRAATVIGKS